MTAAYLVPILFLVTLGAVLIFALVSKERVERRKQDANAGKSTLAADAASRGTPVDV